jgi:alkylation response protein AidB-like acyl-CoA dehydrogenase
MRACEEQVEAFDKHAVAAYFAERAAGVDAGDLDVRDGLKWLAQHSLLSLDLDWRQRADAPGLVAVGELISVVAAQCMASAFALWCQRMVIEYVAAAAKPDFPGRQFLQRLHAGELLGSTALGNGMAHLVLGAPLTVRLARADDGVILDGTIAWASNLLVDANAALTVVAAIDVAAGQSYVVAVPLDTPGVEVAPYPRLLALQATRSASVLLRNVRLPANLVMSSLDSCLPRVRPTLLVLQSCFCQGLAHASLDGAARDLPRANDAILREEVERLRGELGRLDRRVRLQLQRPDARRIPMREFVQTRLVAAQLAAAASRLEVKARGGSAYRMDDPANRRFREAAFLAIQAPTEAQLEWELARPQHTPTS